MAGRKAYDRDSYRTDALTLKRRHPDWTMERIARELGVSVRTLHRIVSGQ